MLKDYLVSVFGEKNITEEPVPEVSLPLYCKHYSFKSFVIHGQKYVFLFWSRETTMREYTYRIPILEKKFGLPVVLVLEQTFDAQVKNLLDLDIRFVELGRQVYIPGAGIVLRKTRKSIPKELADRKSVQKEPADRFATQTQLCALYFLYSQAKEHTTKDVMARTGLSKEAARRALRLLVGMGALVAKANESGKVYEFTQDKPAFYRSIESRLFNPVRKEVMARKADLTQDCYEAGYTAMSEWTMLADDYESTYAVSGRHFKEIDAEYGPVTDMLLYSNDYVILQVWKYDPALFSDTEGCADKVSVWLSMMMDKPDERTEKEVHKLMDEILGWHPEDEDYWRR